MKIQSESGNVKRKKYRKSEDELLARVKIKL